jgi:hypothetical protein
VTTEEKSLRRWVIGIGTAGILALSLPFPQLIKRWDYQLKEESRVLGFWGERCEVSYLGEKKIELIQKWVSDGDVRNGSRAWHLMIPCSGLKYLRLSQVIFFIMKHHEFVSYTVEWKYTTYMVYFHNNSFKEISQEANNERKCFSILNYP